MNKKIKKRLISLYLEDLNHSYTKLKAANEILNLSDITKSDIDKRLTRLKLYISMLDNSKPSDYDKLVNLEDLAEYYYHDIMEDK